MSPPRNPLLLGVILIALAARGAADNAEPRAGLTSVPLIYLMHYVPDAPRNTDFVDQIRLAPPDILHLGHAVPLNSIFGPTADYTGFNPKLVPAAEILDRKQELRKFVALLHEAGVKKVIPYINPSILGGDHVTRKGFFDFYDHWENYAALGIGPKPARPPELWMQRGRRSFAPWKPEPNYPLWRYEPCANEPAWRQYQSAVVRLIAKSGYDGVFVDDCIMECHHDLCAKRFADFLQRRYSPKTLRRVFGSDLGLGHNEPSGAADAHTRLREAETYLFWQDSIADLLAELNRAGRAVNPDFFTVPNWGASGRVGGAGARVRSGKNAAVWRRAATFQLFEEDHPTGYAGPGDVISYLLQYNYGLALGIRPIILSYGTTRGHIELGYAEAAAGGGGAYAESTAAYPKIRRKWRAFFEANRDLFCGFRLTAPVGLIFSMDEPSYGNDEHLRQVFAISRALYNLHIPFAAVPPENLIRAQLAQHKVLVAPRIQHLSDAQCIQLKSFVRHGGRLLIDAEFGVRDLLDLPRQSPFAGVNTIPVNPKPPHLASRQGGIVRINSFEELVPRREFALVDALDVRKSDAFMARIKDICAKAPDPDAENRFRQWFASLAGAEVALTEGARDVHTVAYERFGDREGALIVHAVRYAAATWAEEPPVVQPAPLNLDVLLPSGWELQRAFVRHPERSPVVAEARVNSNRVCCEIPTFDFYSMLHLQLKRAGAP